MILPTFLDPEQIPESLEFTATRAVSRIVQFECVRLLDFFQPNEWSTFREEFLRVHNPKALERLKVANERADVRALQAPLDILADVPRYVHAASSELSILLAGVATGLIANFLWDLANNTGRCILCLLVLDSPLPCRASPASMPRIPCTM